MSPKKKIKQMDFSLNLRLIKDFQFEVDFELPNVGEAGWIVDETPEIGGEGKGPNASRLLGSALGFCLSASLAFCLRKSRLEVKNLKTKVSGVIERNKEGYWRIQAIQVEISPSIEPKDIRKIKRCKEIFEKYCIVSESIREGIPVDIKLNFL